MSELVHHERLSPNYNERQLPITMVVLHYRERASPNARVY